MSQSELEEAVLPQAPQAREAGQDQFVGNAPEQVAEQDWEGRNDKDTPIDTNPATNPFYSPWDDHGIDRRYIRPDSRGSVTPTGDFFRDIGMQPKPMVVNQDDAEVPTRMLDGAPTLGDIPNKHEDAMAHVQGLLGGGSAGAGVAGAEPAGGAPRSKSWDTLSQGWLGSFFGGIFGGPGRARRKQEQQSRRQAVTDAFYGSASMPSWVANSSYGRRKWGALNKGFKRSLGS